MLLWCPCECSSRRGITRSCALIISPGRLFTRRPPLIGSPMTRAIEHGGAGHDREDRKSTKGHRRSAVRRTRHANRVNKRTHTHTALYTHTHTHARSVTQSLNSSRADPSIARCLGSNHHSQQCQYERMADRLWRRLSRPRLMTQISWRVLPHRVQHTAKDPSPPYATWKCASDYFVRSVYSLMTNTVCWGGVFAIQPQGAKRSSSGLCTQRINVIFLHLML